MMFCRYTALVSVSHGGSGPIHTTPLYKLIKNIVRSKFIEKVSAFPLFWVLMRLLCLVLFIIIYVCIILLKLNMY